MRPVWALTAALGFSVCACGRPGPGVTTIEGGDPERGAALIRQVGCGACHEIPGIRTARGLVGPPLTRLSRRTVVAGVLANTPDNLVHWISAPQAVVPGNAMPDMGLSDQQARDVAAFLESLR